MSAPTGISEQRYTKLTGLLESNHLVQIPEYSKSAVNDTRLAVSGQIRSPTPKSPLIVVTDRLVHGPLIQSKKKPSFS